MSLMKVYINKNYTDLLLQSLADLRIAQIKPLPPDKKIEKKSPEVKEELKALKQDFKTLLKKLNITESDFQDLKVPENKRIKFEIKNIYELTNYLTEEIYYFLNRITELERYIIHAKIELNKIKEVKESYKFLENYNINRDVLTIFKVLNFRIYITSLRNLDNLRSLFKFSEFPCVYQYGKISDNRITFFVIYPKKNEDDLISRIKILNAEEIPILKKYLSNEGVSHSRIDQEMEIIENTLFKYEREFERIRDENLITFAAINEVINNIEYYRWAEEQFDEITSNMPFIKFYIPTEKKFEIARKLKDKFNDDIIIKAVDITRTYTGNKIREFEDVIKNVPKRKKSKYQESDEDEIKEEKVDENKLRAETPRIYKHNRFIRPFETLINLYGTPSYSEVDPTPFVAITFPLIFGLMFGDIGHGIVLIIAGLIGGIIFRKKGGNIRNFSWILVYCGIGAIFAGFLYGEFFGTEEFFGIKLVPLKIGNFTLYNPLNNIMSVLYVAILIGVVQINFGWLIQFLNYWRQKRKYFAFTDSLMKIILLSGGTYLIFDYGFDLKSWLSYPYPINLVIIPGLFLIISKPLGKLFRVSYVKESSFTELFGEGSMEAFETFLSILSNVSSYTRLLALAMAHISLMIAIQAMITLIPEIFIVKEILSVIALIFGNVVVILLEGLIAFLNALRLHFYEFFFKFYEGSGTEFRVFSLKSQFSRIKFRIAPEKDILSEEIEKEIETRYLINEMDKTKNYLLKKYF